VPEIDDYAGPVGRPREVVQVALAFAVVIRPGHAERPAGRCHDGALNFRQTTPTWYQAPQVSLKPQKPPDSLD
jgi:hypothetical protein